MNIMGGFCRNLLVDNITQIQAPFTIMTTIERITESQTTTSVYSTLSIIFQVKRHQIWAASKRNQLPKMSNSLNFLPIQFHKIFIHFFVLLFLKKDLQCNSVKINFTRSSEIPSSFVKKSKMVNLKMLSTCARCDRIFQAKLPRYWSKEK